MRQINIGIPNYALAVCIYANIRSGTRACLLSKYFFNGGLGRCAAINEARIGSHRTDHEWTLMNGSCSAVGCSSPSSQHDATELSQTVLDLPLSGASCTECAKARGAAASPRGGPPR